MKNWYSICALNEGAEISIYDEIGAYGVSAKAFLADLGRLPDKAPLTLRLNSPGGSVFDAVAIYNALQRHTGTVTVTIDGIAASAASYIAMAGDEIVMPENAFLMIHDPSGMVMGTAAGMRSMAEALDKIGGSLIRGYAAKTGKPEDEIAALMARETWLDATEALEMGFADTMSGPVRIAASFDVSRFRNAPPEIIEAVAGEAVEQEPAAPEADMVGDDNDVDPATGSAQPASPRTDVADDNIPSADEEPGSTVAAASTAPDQTYPSLIRAVAKAVPVPDPIPDPVAIRAEALTYAKTVVDLCRLAGQPQMAAAFLTAETSLEDIRKALIDTKAADEADISSGHPQPGAGPQAKPWGDVIARTFKTMGKHKG